MADPPGDPNAQGRPEPQVETTLTVVRSKAAEVIAILFSLPTFVAVIIGLCMIYVYNTSSGDGNISDVAFARGLITLLFSVGTIAIAVVLTFAALFQTDADAKERFNRGKEVLAVLIGILGTVVGFYFGSLDPVSNNPLIQSVSPAEIPVGQGSAVTVVGEGFGGAPLLIIGNDAMAISSHTANRIVANVSANTTAQAGDLSVRVVNTETGKSSNAINVAVVKDAEAE